MGTHSEAGLISLTSERAYEAWYPAHKPPHVSPGRFELHDFAAERIGINAPAQYLEYGVHSGTSIRRFASIFANPAARFYGFDSFIGLPESWGNMTPGHFSTGGKLPEMSDPRIELLPGWFQNTARDFLPRLDRSKPTLVHFDADLYSSTLFLLSSLWWCLPEYFFVFDEFIGQEMAALRTFVSTFPAKVEFFSRVDSDIGEPVQIFGRMRATRMVVDGVG